MSIKQTALSPDGFATFGDLLHYLRERAHLTQRELAVLVGYHHSYVATLKKFTQSR
ncbi:MAG: helix-turn-helix domain-containing protein [Anaerolineales bacterium]|nr:helix-turn-helix domain-containing protein [Anaerolineales bacterium]